MRNSKLTALVISLFLLANAEAHAGLGDKWNKFREKHIDPVGDKAEATVREARDDVKEEVGRGTDDLNKFREKYIDPIGDAKSVDDFIDATGNATIKIATTPLKVTYEGVSWVAETANKEVVKPVARYFKKNWDELQAAEPEDDKYQPGSWVDKIKVYNGLAGNIVIATGKTAPKNFKESLVHFTVPNGQGRKLKLPEKLDKEEISVFVKWHPSYCKDQPGHIGPDCWARVHYGLHKLPMNLSVTYDEFSRINVKYDADSLIQDLQ